MFGLIRLMAYAALGYVLYEFFSGLNQGGGFGGFGGQRAQGGSSLDRALNAESGRMSTLTGPGLGTSVPVEDESGATSSQVVGRGVTE